MYGPDRDFAQRSAMTLPFDLETWFIVTAHPLPKVKSVGEVRARLCKGKENML